MKVSLQFVTYDSSKNITEERKSPPGPCISSGMKLPIKPRAPALVNNFRMNIRMNQHLMYSAHLLKKTDPYKLLTSRSKIPFSSHLQLHKNR